ncbi:hypothetical protein Hypma_014021 [Hypsizygus marmoreus]|uniref:F-box domain-containing protein n=1 Tax=Hypsizygus marmoreus TaxID=39966 RepID=A0A369KDN2_HYPMA|nr:hypothetical protein Hypma_014021 [Hypsizygus marmoreus]
MTGFSAPMPLEIISYILEDFDHRTQTLHACSLASHVFLASTRKILFSVVSLTPERSLTLSALMKADPGLSEYIQDIYIDIPHVKLRQRKYDTALQAILNTLSPRRLQMLHLEIGEPSSRHSWGKLSLALRAAVERILKFPSLETVNFMGTKNIPWNFLDHLSQTKSLTLSASINMKGLAINDKPEGQLQQTVTTGVASLRCAPDNLDLSYNSKDLPASLTALRTILDLSHLHTLVLSLQQDDTDAIQTIMQDSLESLESFTCYCFFDEFSNQEPPDFSAVRNLRVMRIATDTNNSARALQWLFRVLKRLASSPGEKGVVALDVLTLHIDTLDNLGFRVLASSPTWADLDNILTSPPFANLKDVKVYIADPPSVSWLLSYRLPSGRVEDIIQLLLPALHAKGLLEARPTHLSLEEILDGAEETFELTHGASDDSNQGDEMEESESEDRFDYIGYSHGDSSFDEEPSEEETGDA